MFDLATNQKVITPNGWGVMWGSYEGGKVLVSHAVKDLTGTQAGECITPKGILSKLFVYQPADVKPGGKR